MGPEFAQLYAAAFTNGCEVTLTELIVKFELGGDKKLLEQLEIARQILEKYDLQLVPGLTSGDLNSSRILRTRTSTPLGPDFVRQEIAKREGPKTEFKETLHFDVKRASASPTTPVSELRSPDVLHASLKTVAAFLNCGGGILLVGVKDCGACSGIEKDFPLVKGNSADGWELDLRSNIEGKFKDGKLINDYVAVSCTTVDGATVAVLKVQGRRATSFVRPKSGPFTLYRRQGNRSLEVPIEEMEEFLQLRRDSGWS